MMNCLGNFHLKQRLISSRCKGNNPPLEQSMDENGCKNRQQPGSLKKPQMTFLLNGCGNFGLFQIYGKG